jgi:hypothetical protein
MAKAVKKTEATHHEPETKPVERPMDGSKAKEIIEEYGGISKAMRALAAEGRKHGEIAKILNKRYQHVRNVMITPVGKNK